MRGRQTANLRGPKDERPQKAKRKQKNSSALDALTVAEIRFPEKNKIRKHRLGELEDDHSNRKRDGPSTRDDWGEPDAKRLRTDYDENLSNAGGSDSDGNRWQIGQVNSDDDSELDSDEALGPSDEERFEGFTFRGSSSARVNKKGAARPSTQSRKIDLSENILSSEGFGGSEDDLGDDAVDLATAWDMNADTDEDVPRNRSNSHSENTHTKLAAYTNELDIEDDQESGDESDLPMSDVEPEEKAETRSGLKKLHSFIDSIKLEQPKVKWQEIHRGQENGVPTEYGLTSTRKLTVADLIPSITDSRLRTSLKQIDSSILSNKGKPSGTSGKLSAPLAKRQQARLDRAAAYEKSKETLDRWIDTVKANRQAEHLSFPLVDSDAQHMPRLGTVKPQTDLESTIQSILVQSGLSESKEQSLEDQILASEEMQTKKLSLEEARARTAELRKRRDLLFREEIRAKRISKIKSKAYRRVHRREREKMAGLEKQALLEAGVDLDEEEKERNDRRRAEARMGAKHKESKWAKSLKQTGRAAWDEDARLGITDMARRDRELQQRIEGKTVREADDEFLGSSTSESEDGGDPWAEEEEDAQNTKIHRKLDELERQDDSSSNLGLHSKLLSMKFMQSADASRKLQNEKDIRRLRREIAGDQSSDEEDDEDGGRRKFGSMRLTTAETASIVPQNEFEELPDSDDEEFSKSQPVSATRHKPASTKQSRKSPALFHSDPQLPTAVVPKISEASVDNPWLSQPARKNKKLGEVNSEGTVDIAIDDGQENSISGKKDASTKIEQLNEKRSSRSHRTNGTSAQFGKGQNDDEDDDDEEDERIPILIKNHDLVQKAFAGDEVVADFEKEKKATIEDEGDKIIDNTLPGWGSWTGQGISKKQQRGQKRFITKIEGVKPEQRKDAKLKDVIINEKRVRKNVKYLASHLPHPFESRQQYERSLRLPIGPEWTTKSTFQDATKPRVLMKQGIIKPMEKPLI